MKTISGDAFKIFICKAALGAAAMFAAAVVLAMVQGAVALLPGALLLLFCLLVLNALCGLLAPAPHSRTDTRCAVRDVRRVHRASAHRAA